MQEFEIPYDMSLPTALHLRAGDLDAMYEDGNLRYIRSGETELVRKIYGAVRNLTWHTLVPRIHKEEITVSDRGFRVSYTAYYGTDPILFKAGITIDGDAGNRIIFEMAGEVMSPFTKSRIGLCVHHPVKECLGGEVSVVRPDGSQYKAFFPDKISPFQPLLDLHKQQWVTADGYQVDLIFEGDIFETEDQRNWSDSSFKTYSTPLEIPFPVDVKPGDRFDQRITLTVKQVGGVTADQQPDMMTEEKGAFPQIGYSRALKQESLSDELAAFLREIPFDLYRVPIILNDPGWQAELRTAVDECERVGARLHLSVKFSSDFIEEEVILAKELQPAIPLIDSLLVLHSMYPVSPTDLLHYIYPRLKKSMPSVEVGYGTEHYFANLNRQPPRDSSFDFLSFHLQPQVHAFDNRTILENLENLPDLVASAKLLSGGKPVAVSPVTLNDCSGPDARQYSSFAAHWMLMSLQNLSPARHIIFFEVTGRAGLITAEDDSTISLSAAYKVLTRIHQFKPVHIIRRKIGGRLLLNGLLLENSSGDRLFFRSPEEYVTFKSNK